MNQSFVYALHKTGVYAALDIVRDYGTRSTSGRRTSFSQFGEDKFLSDYFRDWQGVYIDVGGNHPINLSNTYLLYRRGWKGLVVEPIRRLYEKHRRIRPRDVQVNAAAGSADGQLTFYEVIPSVLSTCETAVFEELLSSGKAILLNKYTVPVVTVAELHRERLQSCPVSLLSVDTEGHGMDVLCGVDWEAMHPEVVICEANTDSRQEEITRFLSERGYKRAAQTGCNLIFSLK